MTEHRPRYAFDHHIFESSTFDCHKFINTVAHANGLEQVRTDLQDHLTTVQNNLLSLVHRDYADFVQLSSELEGVDVTLQECQRPIVDLHRATKQLKDAAEFFFDPGAPSLGGASEEPAALAAENAEGVAAKPYTYGWLPDVDLAFRRPAGKTRPGHQDFGGRAECHHGVRQPHQAIRAGCRHGQDG